ncbi:MAG: hypothetical protein PF569_05520 [Candidatus Woesearchaeota archaeon]|jgi:hypothetical protein|nr:hypothetical protein [Candidatus Woesearchaeota archaeon]
MKKINLERICRISSKSLLTGLSLFMLNSCGGGGGGSDSTNTVYPSSQLAECQTVEDLSKTLSYTLNSTILTLNSYPAGVIKTNSEEIEDLYFQIRDPENKPIYDGIILKESDSSYSINRDIFEDCSNCPNTQINEDYTLIISPRQDENVCTPNFDGSITEKNAIYILFKKE